MSKYDGGTTDERDGRIRDAQGELKRAYMHVSFGQFDLAIAACERAAEAAPEHHLPVSLKGSFEMSAGRVRDALGTLRGATRRFSDQALPKIYFAEACFLAGRRRQGERALQQAEKLCSGEAAEQYEQFIALIDNLRQAWESVEPSEVPPPLVVELEDEAEA